MKSIFLMTLFSVALCGCSKQSGGLSLSGASGSGDLVPPVMQCVTKRGGFALTNTLPVVNATWTHQSRDLQDIFLTPTDHFDEIQKVLEQAYGAPDPNRGSSAVAPVGNGRALTYSPQQCGVVLNLTAASQQTVVSVMGRQKSP
jgi:hypothetical protein